MPETLLRTKLFVPQLRPNLVPRPHLIQRLNHGLQLGHKLTLMSAPAGFGKTTLVSEWIAEGKRPSAWISLDEGDSKLPRFLTYLVAALQTVVMKADDGKMAVFGQATLEMVQSPQPPPIDTILTVLLNEIATIPEKFILILDDYHVIDANRVDNALTFLLEHLPPQMHLVITTREDLNLPLPRLRARGQLTELRVKDLRFTLAEASDFFIQVMGLSLSPGDLAALASRTEGWIAGLQLAALSIRGREDLGSFIRSFAGDNRYIFDYLIEEVMKRQSERIRDFLLETSLFDRLTGPLCDAVTGQEDGKLILEELERDNLFVVPLDDRRQWYRYHHLFADVLQVLFKEEQPDQVPVLHRRASEWYEQNGYPADAIHHALAGKDYERAAGMLELGVRDFRTPVLEATWLGWVRALPDELVRTMPVLSVYYALALMTEDLDEASARLRDAEGWLGIANDNRERPEAPAVVMIVVNEAEFHSLPATISIARAYLAGTLGDVKEIAKHARRSLELLPESDFMWRGGAAALLGFAYWNLGDLEAAYQSILEGMVNLHKADGLSLSTGPRHLLADIRFAQGRLRAAFSTIHDALQLLSEEQGDPFPLGIGDLYVVLGELHLEQGDLDGAEQHLLRSKELGEQARSLELRHRWYLAMARLKEAQGDLNEALELLSEGERMYIGGPVPEARPMAAMKARIWVRQGRLTEARDWVRDRALSVEDDPSYLREFEHITLARLLLTRYQHDRADNTIQGVMRLLNQLLTAAEAGGRAGSVIEILVLLALAQQAQGDLSSALDSLERALSLAEPEGFVQIFVEEGPPMVALLRESAKRGASLTYVKRLWRAIGEPGGREAVKHPLIEPLTARELEVLKLFGTELSGPEIARELTVTLNTIRTHTKNIYSKLGVNNRRAAVRRAEELDLF